MDTLSCPISCLRKLLFPALLTCLQVMSFPLLHASESASDERVVLRMQTLPRQGSTGLGSEVIREIVREFGKEYPQYKLEPFNFPALEGMAMDQGPLMSIATGVPPHGIYVNFRQSSTYINHGFLIPLEILLARHLSANPLTREYDEHGNWLADPSEKEIAAALELLMERVSPAAHPVVYRSADTERKGIPDGEHLWAMPYANVVSGLMYRKDVFVAAGLDPEHPPQTWEELLDYSRKIRALPGKFGFMFATGPNVSWSVFNFLASNGVIYMERDADGRWRAAFNNMEAAEAIYFILRLVRERFETDDERRLDGAAFAPLAGGSEMNIMWDRGEIGMKFNSGLSFERDTNFNPALIGIAPIPSPNKKTKGAGQFNSTMLGVFSGATPAQQLGVARYIWFRTGERARSIHTRMFVDAGYGTFLDPAMLKRFGYDDILRRVPETWRVTMSEAMEHGVPEPYGRNTQMIYPYVSEPINWALERPELLELPKEEALTRIKNQLDTAAERVNRFMLGELTEQEWLARRIAGTTVFVLIIAIFTISIVWVWRAFSSQERAGGDKPSSHKNRIAYSMILPGLLLVIFVAYLPLILGIPLALFDYQLVLESRFVGLDNFATILYDQRFWESMVRTFQYVLMVIGLGFWPPILVAVLLDEVPGNFLKYFFRTIFYLPTIVSGIIMVFLWRQFYDPSESGVLNQLLMSLNHLGPVAGTMIKLLMLLCWFSLIGFIFACSLKLKELSMTVRSAVGLFALALLVFTLMPLLRAYIGPDELTITARGLDPDVVSGFSGIGTYLGELFGPFKIQPLRWIEDPGMAMLCVVIPMVWASAGPGCIIYLAALKTVPEDLVEAAAIDGAGLIQRASYITLPRIKFLIMIQLMGAAIGAFKGGTNFIMVMTGGGPNGATRTMGLDIFQRAWMELNFSSGAAMGWILGAIVIVLTCQHLRRMSRASFSTAATKQ